LKCKNKSSYLFLLNPQFYSKEQALNDGCSYSCNQVKDKPKPIVTKSLKHVLKNHYCSSWYNLVTFLSSGLNSKGNILALTSRKVAATTTFCLNGIFFLSSLFSTESLALEHRKGLFNRSF
jgi:hypothetical protein